MNRGPWMRVANGQTGFTAAYASSRTSLRGDRMRNLLRNTMYPLLAACMLAVPMAGCGSTDRKATPIAFSNSVESQRFRGIAWLGDASGLVQFEHYLLGIGGQTPLLHIDYANTNRRPVRLDILIEWYFSDGTGVRSAVQHNVRGIVLHGESESLVYQPAVVPDRSKIVSYLIIVYLVATAQLGAR